MNWKSKMAEFGGSNVTFLSEDGEIITFVVVGDPELMEGKFKGNNTRRIACPIVSSEGFSILIVGMRVARRLSKYENLFASNAFVLTRHGDKGDQAATYDLAVCGDADVTDELFTYKKNEFDPAELEDALRGAKEIIEA